ncbi:PP2C family serine/threonine-protein phosphatase [Roseovarius sp. EL26]|uniref:PP2C family protein-serine/threonine phosphatase n=1 Tax=Roseovarius sp. EL26 TaxID=2126672 RepID=UPI000EA273D9|nr:protein phosphatase 2C domain-containing protein [Roseovarius sp. EL26]
MLAAPTYDIAVIADQGRRETQEDAIATRTFDTAEAAYVVVADGMGGHEAGEVASDLVTKAWRSVLDVQLEDSDVIEGNLMDALPIAAMQANADVSGYTENSEGALKMGSTMLGTLLLKNRLFWISIGDSPLYLFRDGYLVQINEDHSMAPMIDAQVQQGLLSAEEAKVHPDRNQLTSVIMGAPIPKVDCPSVPLELTPSDVLIAASDGLQYLEDAQILEVLNACAGLSAQEISDSLLTAVHSKEDPDQDNISIAVVKLLSV